MIFPAPPPSSPWSLFFPTKDKGPKRPNADGCSGHGLCQAKDQCLCDAGYFGADCSLRSCPYDYAFVDTPAGDLNHDGVVSAAYVQLALSSTPAWSYEMFPTDETKGYQASSNEGHFYKECSGVGSCDRSAGTCTCFAGYTGSACQRSTCPNDCSGNGVCRTLREVAAGALSRAAVSSSAGSLLLSGVRTPFAYQLWDADKHQQCVCDPGYGGPDCSARTCPRGTDPLVPPTARWCGGVACTYEVQTFTLSSADTTLYSFSFTDLRNFTHVAFASVNTVVGVPGYVYDQDVATNLAAPGTNAGAIMAALRQVPGGLLQSVEVRAYPGAGVGPDTVPSATAARTFLITYVGLSGNQYNIEVAPVNGAGYVQVAPSEVTGGNREDKECSGRGLCDATKSVCNCFSGYFGVACENQNALATGAHATGQAVGGSSR